MTSSPQIITKMYDFLLYLLPQISKFPRSERYLLGRGVSKAVKKIVDQKKGGVPLEVEVQNLDQLREALKFPVDIILLDNFTPAQVKEAVSIGAGRVRFEASGGITLANVRAYAETGVDFLSVGALTHSAPAVDLSLEFAS